MDRLPNPLLLSPPSRKKFLIIYICSYSRCCITITHGTLSANPKVHAITTLSQSLHDLDDFNNFIFTGSYDISTLLNSGSFQPGDCLYLDYRAAFDGGEFGASIGGYANGQPMTNITVDGIFEISSSAASGPEIETIPEPFFSQDFATAHDCQPTFNNAIINRRGYLHQEVDYTSGVYLPTNFDLIIDGKALKAEVQDSNYTTKRHIRPRYEGSKNTTDDFNSSAITQSTYFQNLHPNDDLGVSTLRYPSVTTLDTTIHEFRFGGGTYPEIATGGAVLIDQMLNVSSKDSSNISTPTTEGFNDILKIKFPINSKPTITQYTTTSGNVAGAKVMSINTGVPSKSNYIATTSDPSTQVAPTSITQIAITSTIKEVSTNSSGNYITGSYTPVLAAKDIISSSLNDGHRWYITIYNQLPDIVQGTLEPFNSGATNNYYITDTNGDYPNPLAKNGVYEITKYVTSNEFTITPPLPEVGWTAGNGDKGCLIWRSSGVTSIEFDNATLSGVGKGNLITPTPSETIIENLTYITKTYGTNT